MKSILAAIKALLIALSALLVTVLQTIYYLFFFWNTDKYVWFFPSLFHKLACLITGIKTSFHGDNFGKTHKGKPLLYASNHTTYLDIVVIGSWLRGMFVAKSDIAGWPVFGFLAKLQGTIFVERRPSAARKQKDVLKEYVNKGAHLVIFPEGTTTLGTDVLKFKSSLFGAFMPDESKEETIYIQPMAVTYTHMDGSVLNDETREILAWYRDDESLIPHLWRFLKHGKIKVTISFADPIAIQKTDDRKDLAQQSWHAVLKLNKKNLS